jgi:hypothetical protein
MTHHISNQGTNHLVSHMWNASTFKVVALACVG